jgi:hypothetical protein
MSLTTLIFAGCSLAEPPTPTPIPVPPTATPVPTDTPIVATPTPASTAIPTDTPLPPTETLVPTPTLEVYQLLAQNHFDVAIRTTAVVGVFRYNDKYTPINPPVTVDLLDADGKIVASEEAFVSPWVVKPGALIPFRAIFHDPPSTWQSYKFTVEFGEMSDFFRRSYSTAMEVVESTLAQQTELGYGPKIVGTVMNTGPADFHMQQIIGVLWDAEGNLLDVTTGHTTLGGLAAGEERRFEVEFNNGKGGAKYDLLVAGYLKH